MGRRRRIGLGLGPSWQGTPAAAPVEASPPERVGVWLVPMEAQIGPRQAHPSFLASVLGHSVPPDSCPPFGNGVFADVIKMIK